MSGSSDPGAPADADAALARELAAWLAARGLDLRGTLAPERYDARVPPAWRSDHVLPGTASVQLFGSSGGALWRALRAAPEWGPGAGGRRTPDPLDRYTERTGAEACARLRAAGRAARVLLAHTPRAGTFADFVALGREAGLGAPGRLGLLLHPERGPWSSLRLLLLSELRLPPSSPLRDFAPCVGCAAPCASACHGEAVLPEGFDVARCAAARERVPACRARCDARHACVLGPAHAYDAEAEAHHMIRGGVAIRGAVP